MTSTMPLHSLLIIPATDATAHKKRPVVVHVLQAECEHDITSLIPTRCAVAALASFLAKLTLRVRPEIRVIALVALEDPHTVRASNVVSFHNLTYTERTTARGFSRSAGTASASACVWFP
jgi:hypothetical protein